MVLRVVVIEDSRTVSRHLVRTMERAGDIVVVGIAEDGPAGIEMCLRLRPDVITLDLVLPTMSGIAVTEHIMAYMPTPILVVSAAGNRDEAHRTYDALAAGAVDVLEKTPCGGAEGSWESRLVSTVRLVARVPVMTHPNGRRRAGAASLVSDASRIGLQAPIVQAHPARPHAVALGASTGGPGALSEVLRGLVHPCPVPILIVQHLSPAFSDAYGEWLDRQSAHRVAYVSDGEPLADARGRVVMAPPGQHLVLRDGRLRATLGAERNFCRPSVDVLFESLAVELGARAAAVLLTGMGKDGAAGLLRVRQNGGVTLAQDEESSIVFGMPREAALMGAAQSVLPLVAIGPAISALICAPETG